MTLLLFCNSDKLFPYCGFNPCNSVRGEIMPTRKPFRHIKSFLRPSGDIGNSDHRHRKAVLSEYHDSGTALINAAIQKFPECKDAFEELLTLQGYNSFTDMNLSGSPFVKMALESQHKTHPSPSAQSDF